MSVILTYEMIKSLHKPAKRLSLLKLPHPGILDPEGFNLHFDLRCYKPSLELEPFVVHIWAQRRRSSDITYRPTEILSGPNLYLFITSKEAFIHGILPRRFKYDAEEGDVVAGVKFKPGGFYPFWRHSLSKLAGKTTPASLFFPEIDADFIKNILASSDEEIVARLEKLLKDRHPVDNKSIHLTAKVMDVLNSDETLQTVKDIARSVGRSERSLQLLFSTYVGVSLKWVIARRRLLRTVQKIHNHTSPTWTEAAAEEGYSSQSHFTRELKDAIGLPPSQYLKTTYNNRDQ